MRKGPIMASIKVLATGRIDERDSAFPKAVQLPGGDVLCSFSVGGGPNVDGGTELARSTDGGETWAPMGAILQPTTDPYTTNFLKLSLSNDGHTVYAYGDRSDRPPGGTFGEGRDEAVLCRSTDEGRTWSAPQVIPMPGDCALEISFSALVLGSGRMLAPAATLPAPDRLGETMLVAVSDDDGRTWPRHATIFQDPQKRFGYFEHKFAEFAPDRVMAVCWTVTLGDVVDQPDSFAISSDGGLTWGPARSTGIMGQTMSILPLGGDRLLALYNRRYGDQGIVMSLVTFTDDAWTVHWEGVMFDAGASRTRPDDVETGVEEFDAFAFGFPTAIALQDGTILATHWSKESAEGRFGIRWTKLRVAW